MKAQKSVFAGAGRPAASVVVPRVPDNATGAHRLDATPIPALQAPAPSGTEAVFFKRSDKATSASAQLAAFLGRNDLATEAVAATAQFTKDDLERKNQESVKAWLTGPIFPIGGSSGSGANTLQPFVNAPANRERLNAGTPVRPELGAPYLRGIGNAFSGVSANTRSWAAMAEAQTGSANVDPAGFAQVNHTGNFIADRDSSYHPERGGLNGGPLSGINYGGVNAGAVFSKQDGAAGGDVGFTLLKSQAGSQPFSFIPPSGSTALEVPRVYGLSSLINSAR